MTKEELIKFLKEELTIELSANEDCFHSPTITIDVTLYLGDEEISSSSDNVDIDESIRHYLWSNE